MTKAVTIDLDDDALEAFERAAVGANRETASFIAEVLRAHARLLDQSAGEDWVPSDEDLAAIHEGLAAVERGDTVSHAEVMAGARRITNGEGR